MIFRETFRVRKQLRKPENLIESRHRRRQSALRLRQELTFAVDHLHAKTACVGVRVHESQAFTEGIVFDHRVGIEQQNILACRDTDSLVVGLCEADIVFICYDFHFGELRREHLQRAIDRVIVDHKHLTINALHGAAHRVEALFEEMLYVVVDYDDRQFHILVQTAKIRKILLQRFFIL